MLVTVVAQFIAKTINSKRPIYFLSLMSCSINKLKSHMLFTCKNFKFSNFTWEKQFLLQEMVGGLPPPAPPPFSTALHKHKFCHKFKDCVSPM